MARSLVGLSLRRLGAPTGALASLCLVFAAGSLAATPSSGPPAARSRAGVAAGDGLSARAGASGAGADTRTGHAADCTASSPLRPGGRASPDTGPEPEGHDGANGRDASHGCRGSSWRRPRTIGARLSSHSSPLSPPSTGACSPWRDCCSHSSRSAAVSCFRSPGASYRRCGVRHRVPGSAGPTGAGVRSVRRSSGTVRTHPDVLALAPQRARAGTPRTSASPGKSSRIHPDRCDSRPVTQDTATEQRSCSVSYGPRRCVREDDHHPPRRRPSASDGSDAVPPALTRAPGTASR